MYILGVDFHAEWVQKSQRTRVKPQKRRHFREGASTPTPGPELGREAGAEYKKHPRGLVSEQESGPGTAHFLLRLCKPQAGPSGNRVTVEESLAARAGFGAASRGSADQGERPRRDAGGGRGRGRGSRTHASLPRAESASPKTLSAPRERRVPRGAASDARCGVRGAPTLGGLPGRSRRPRSLRPSFLPTSPMPPATLDLASRTRGGPARGREGNARETFALIESPALRSLRRYYFAAKLEKITKKTRSQELRDKLVLSTSIVSLSDNQL
ncbi:uncharacterized protein LOC125961788 [Orcinus orca]|uniref:uncharacterized protein LOC125961788 n=1 Tax=Orcinus orca TaxID=9733 RepID=UPI00211209CD|nr:uncharacterized protein LOC125961788 [Orcinus orca]